MNVETAELHEHEQVETWIRCGTHIEGRVHVRGPLRVDGRVTGQLWVEGRCDVGTDGFVEAPVHATELTVAGRIVGDVDVSGRLHLLSGGSIVGDVRTRTLLVEEGGMLEGNCMQGSEDGAVSGLGSKGTPPGGRDSLTGERRMEVR